jgi:hypothetical protein
MKVHELIEKLQECNQSADIDILINNTPFSDITLGWGISEGCTKENCECISLNVDAFDKPETPII